MEEIRNSQRDNNFDDEDDENLENRDSVCNLPLNEENEI